MPNPEILAYIKEQQNAGYSAKEIKNALLSAGWEELEIRDAFDSLESPGKPEKQKKEKPKSSVYPPVDVKEGRNHSFIISIIGGLLIFVFALETVLSLQLITSTLVNAGLSINLLGLFAGVLESDVNMGIVLIIFAVDIILGSLLINREGRERMGGILVLVFSVLSLIGFNGSLLIIGSVLGIIGSILAIKNG